MKIFIGALLLTLSLCLGCSGAFAADASEPNRINLNADKITFEEDTGIATAEGDVSVLNKDLRLFAPYIEYDSEKSQLKALSTQEGQVTFISGSRRLSGERLDYDIATKRGLLTHPNGKVEEFYIRGEAIEVMPVSDVTKKRWTEGVSSEDLAGRWLGAVATTCPKSQPDYRLEAKQITVVPGKRIVVKKPRVYLGERMVFAYPFDYIIPLNQDERRKRGSLFPKVGYESQKGAGLGVSGPFAWETGSLNLEVIGWTEGMWEGDVRLEQDIRPGLTAYGGISREYDKDRDITLWRPNWGLDYDWRGWRMNVGWAQRELVKVEKAAGRDSKFVVWRQPEVSLLSPWFEDRAVGGRFRVFGSWGRYEDATNGHAQSIERTGLGIQTTGEFGHSARENFQPFYNALYWYYSYDTSNTSDQQILDAVAGIRWHAGDFKMETAYLRRWSWGNSPMQWDDYESREEIYQSVDIRFPAKGEDRWWNLGVRGAYSFDRSELAEMVYKVGYELDCMRWDLVYRDQRSWGDNWVGLHLTIKAYPDTSLRLAGDEIFEPSKAPDSLIPKNVRRD